MKKLKDLPYKIGKKPDLAKQIPYTGKDEKIRSDYHQGIIERKYAKVKQ